MQDVDDLAKYLALVDVLAETDTDKSILSGETVVYPVWQFRRDAESALEQLNFDTVELRKMRAWAQQCSSNGHGRHILHEAIARACDDELGLQALRRPRP